jgi:uncharacterized iron-regulated membrane protein
LSRGFRRALLKVHLWTALLLAIPIVIIGISGSALLLQREILRASVPAAMAPGTPHRIEDIIAAARRSPPPHGGSVSLVQLAETSSRPVAVRFVPAHAGAPDFDLYIDPVSLRVLGQDEVVERGPVLAFIIGVHAFLMMPPHIGLPFVGWMGVVMVFMGISGLVLWWPKKRAWRRAFLVRRGARGLALHLDLHHAAGIWGLVVFLAVALSGIYLTFPETVVAGAKRVLPMGIGSGAVTQSYARPNRPIDADEAVALATSAIPEARAISVQLPDDPDTPYVVTLETTGYGAKAPPILATIDAGTGEVSYVDDPRTYAVGNRILNLQHAIHFGVGLGPVWMVLVFLSGLLPLLLAVTGITIWWKRRRLRT